MPTIRFRINVASILLVLLILQDIESTAFAFPLDQFGHASIRKRIASLRYH